MDVTEGLKVNALTKSFDGVTALRNVSLEVSPGEIVALVGPNGSGKSSLFNVISGYFPPTSGEIWWRGQRIDALGSDTISLRGIARTFQEAATFPTLTTRECFEIAARYTDPTEFMQLVGLEDRAAQIAGSLSYGLQRLLGIGMAAATRPDLLLLDEPGAGLTYPETRQVAEVVRRLRERGMTIVVVDHNMSFVLPLCERAIVLSAGEIIFTGRPDDLKDDPVVRRTYLGKE